jgi:(1->4)-alpha-D-glucan 1-alpha-D-glucosylmutase
VVERRYLYESLVAVWPITGHIDEEFVARVRGHMVKAGREAKRRSDWLAPDVEHEARVGEFVERLLARDGTACDDLAAFVATIQISGATNALASVVVRAAAPGVPDIYQGDEAWFLALVDPDNRGVLDVRARTRQLAAGAPEPGASGFGDLLDSWHDGRLKRYVVRRSLRVRRGHRAFFEAAEYEPLPVIGRHRRHVLAFARRTAERAVVCIVPRLTHGLAGGGFPVGKALWGDTAVVVAAGGDDEWTDHLSGHVLRAADGALTVGGVLGRLPVALLERGR